MSFYIKQGVRLFGLQPQIVLAIMVAREVYSEHGHDLVITSCQEGLHSTTSLHYAGAAVDFRSSHWNHPQALGVANEIRERLGGKDFDVIAESGSGGPHIHLEYQPRR